MRRIGLAVVLVLGLALVLHAADAQPKGQTYRIGYLGEGRSEDAPLLRPLWDRLREFGYVFRY